MVVPPFEAGVVARLPPYCIIRRKRFPRLIPRTGPESAFPASNGASGGSPSTLRHPWEKHHGLFGENIPRGCGLRGSLPFP